ncbi:MAG TPA: hypothetical protein VHK64_09755, partial [Nocardioidaceae bacterium]|nr:hypothetical protein [Nocardioidaceae bacterium]
MLRPMIRRSIGPWRRAGGRGVAVIAAAALLAVCASAAARTTASTPASSSPSTTASPGTGELHTEPNPDPRPLHVEVGPGAAIEAGGTLSVAGSCDELDPKACLLPFPNDRFTVPDASTDTGRLVHLDVLSMPRDVAGKPVDPTEWNRNDGFSPSTPILTYVPGLDLAATWGTKAPLLTDLARSLAADAPIVLLDV